MSNNRHYVKGKKNLKTIVNNGFEVSPIGVIKILKRFLKVDNIHLKLRFDDCH